MTSHWILLVDPLRNLLNAYRIVLEGENYQVETASRLQECMEKISLRPYSVLIMEYFPPFEETFLIIQGVKQRHPETYVMMVTNAFIDEPSYEKLLEGGVDDIIFKPYSAKKILAHIRKGLRESALTLKRMELETALKTGLPARPAEPEWHSELFRKSVRRELKRARRHQHPLSLLLLDLPDVEKTTDRMESLFAHLSLSLKKNIREEDILGRDNGHLGILLPQTNQTGCQAVRERISRLVTTHPSLASNKELGSMVKSVLFRSFTYPKAFAVPEPLKPIMEEIEKEYSRRI